MDVAPVWNWLSQAITTPPSIPLSGRAEAPIGVFTPYAAYGLTSSVQEMNFTTARTLGWQQHCWEWAKSGQPFLLHGLGAPNLVFCNELCAAYKYYFSCNDSIATFLPEYSVRDVSWLRTQNHFRFEGLADVPTPPALTHSLEAPSLNR